MQKEEISPEEERFMQACRFGKIDLAKELYLLGNVSIQKRNNYAFRYSCENGHLDIAKWLHSLNNINIHAQDDYAFRYSCFNSHLNVAKWLYSLGDIDIHVINDLTFMLVCGKKSNLHIVKYLLSLDYIDITKDRHFAFRIACENNCLDIVLLLCSMNNNYKFQTDGNKIVKWCYNNGNGNTWKTHIESQYLIDIMLNERRYIIS